MVAQHRRVEFILVGAGGTGGYLISAIARLMLEIEATTNKTCSCTVIDPDIIETKNVPRQNFQPSEIGLYKAQVFAARYSLALGCNITAITKPFHKDMVKREWCNLTVIIGCVDNAAARHEISKCLDNNYSKQPPHIFWLD